MAWGSHWKDHTINKRFSSTQPIHFDHYFAYWFKGYAEYMIAREFLINIKTDYQELIDEATGDYVLLTNYTSITWRNN